MDSPTKQFGDLERELLHDRFADFERAVLQDNIVLCDAKSGILLAFGGAMVIFCVDAFVHGHEAATSGIRLVFNSLFLVAAAGFLISCHFALTTVLPRIRRGRVDHIFWEAPVFRGSLEDYIQTMETLDVSVERRDKLGHLHMLAGICRNKFRHFFLACRSAQVGFVLLVLAELGRLLS